MIRTFLDSGVLIRASRGDPSTAETALRIIEDDRRRFLTSVFVRLEVYPKVAFHQFPLQRALLNEFFMEPSLEWATDVEAVVHLALIEAEYGLGAMDALHVAAARVLNADEFITTEKREKAIYRVHGLKVIHLEQI